MKNRKRADLVVFGRIFTAEDSQLAEAFAVKDGRFIYVGGRKGAEAFVEEGKTEVLDYTGQGLVMPSCGNGHAHYFTGHAMPMVGAVVEAKGDVNKFLTETVPDAVKKAKANGINTVFGFGWDYHLIHDRLPTRQQLDAIYWAAWDMRAFSSSAAAWLSALEATYSLILGSVPLGRTQIQLLSSNS